MNNETNLFVLEDSLRICIYSMTIIRTLQNNAPIDRWIWKRRHSLVTDSIQKFFDGVIQILPGISTDDRLIKAYLLQRDSQHKGYQTKLYAIAGWGGVHSDNH